MKITNKEEELYSEIDHQLKAAPGQTEDWAERNPTLVIVAILLVFLISITYGLTK